MAKQPSRIGSDRAGRGGSSSLPPSGLVVVRLFYSGLRLECDTHATLANKLNVFSRPLVTQTANYSIFVQSLCLSLSCCSLSTCAFLPHALNSPSQHLVFVFFVFFLPSLAASLWAAPQRAVHSKATAKPENCLTLPLFVFGSSQNGTSSAHTHIYTYIHICM